MPARLAETAADRERVMRIAHLANASTEVWPVYAARRLGSVLRRRAAWWLWDDGRADVASLLCYRLVFGLPDGREVAGYGFGSVATHPDHRRRGHATALCMEVAARSEADGAAVGLLFSAIPPALYARMGFAVCAAWDHVCDEPADLAAAGPRCTLRPVDPLRGPGALIEAYRAAHAGTVHLARDAARWRQVIDASPVDLFFATPGGYVRINDEHGGFEVLELIGGDREERAAVLRACGALAAAAGRPLSGWLAPDDAPAPHWRDRGRATTLPMVRGAGVATTRFWGSDYF